MQTEGCSSLEPGVGIEPTSVIHCCRMFTAGCCELVICSPPPEPFGLRWKSLTKASPTPALRSLAPGNFDGSSTASYKASRKFGPGRRPLQGLPIGFCSTNSIFSAQRTRSAGYVPGITSKRLIETLARAPYAIVLSQVNELYACPNCASPIDNCRCACPYCGETAGCDCAIGHGRATGG